MSLLLELPITNKIGWPWNEETDTSLFNATSYWPKITIVTPSFNQGAFIEETIRSILLQNYPNLEYIVIDGGSTDSTVEIIEKYSKWITYWVSEKDKGQSNAINKGFEKSTGFYFNWVNSDDYLAKNALLEIAKITQFDVDIVAGFLNVFSDNNGRYVNTIRYRLKYSVDIYNSIVEHMICQPATFFKASFLKSIDGVSESLDYIMDLHLFVQYLLYTRHPKIELIDSDIAFFREHPNSKTVSNYPRFLEEENFLFRELIAVLKEDKVDSNYFTQQKIDFSVVDRTILKNSILNKIIFERTIYYLKNRNVGLAGRIICNSFGDFEIPFQLKSFRSIFKIFRLFVRNYWLLFSSPFKVNSDKSGIMI